MKRLIKKADDQATFNKIVERDSYFCLKECINKLNSNLKFTRQDFNELLNMPFSEKVNEFAGYNLDEVISAIKSAIKNVNKLKHTTKYTEPYLKELQYMLDSSCYKTSNTREVMIQVLKDIDILNTDYLSKINSEL
jgi:hypothetical protein